MEVERTPGQSIPGCFRKGTNYPLPGRFFLPPVRQPVDFVTSFFRFQPPPKMAIAKSPVNMHIFLPSAV